jgi:hypothetical protein
MTNYFIIYATEDGLRIVQKTESGAVEYLKMFDDSEIKFLERIPDNLNDLFDFDTYTVVVIKGEIIIPKPITLVKEFKLKD